MKGFCKKCGWPWHEWDNNNESDFCKKCFGDPRYEFTPLVLFDQVGLNMGVKIMLAVRVKPDVDSERLPWCFRESVVMDEQVIDDGKMRLTSCFMGSGKVREDIRLNASWRDKKKGVIVVGVVNKDSKVTEVSSIWCKTYTEAEFLEMFEPVKYKWFWREGEFGLLRDEHRIENIMSVQLMMKESNFADFQTNNIRKYSDELRGGHPLGQLKCYAELIECHPPLVIGLSARGHEWKDWLDDRWPQGILGTPYLNHSPKKDRNSGAMAMALEGKSVRAFVEYCNPSFPYGGQ